MFLRFFLTPAVVFVNFLVCVYVETKVFTVTGSRKTVFTVIISKVSFIRTIVELQPGNSSKIYKPSIILSGYSQTRSRRWRVGGSKKFFSVSTYPVYTCLMSVRGYELSRIEGGGNKSMRVCTQWPISVTARWSSPLLWAARAVRSKLPSNSCRQRPTGEAQYPSTVDGPLNAALKNFPLVKESRKIPVTVVYAY